MKNEILEWIAFGLMFALPLSYLFARVIFHAYFAAKLWYHRTMMSNLQKEGD